MESKKLQQMQQANSHLAPHTKQAPPYLSSGTGVQDYQSTHTPVFQNHPQYQQISSNFAQVTHQHQMRHQPPPPLSPPAGNGNGGHVLMKREHSSTQVLQQQPMPSHHHPDQMYQNRERLYQQAPAAAARPHFSQQQQTPQQPPPPPAPVQTHQQQILASQQQQQQQQLTAQTPSAMQQQSHMHPAVTALQQQYQQLQHAKIQQQIQTQSEALVHQQRTFAMRQQLNPPIPQTHYHMQSNQSLHMPQQQQLQQPPPIQQQHLQQQQQHMLPQQQQQLQMQQHIQQQQQQQQRSVPPSTLNLTSQFQPATGPLKLNPNEEYVTAGQTRGQLQTVVIHQQNQHLHTTNQQRTQSQAIYHQNQMIQQQLLQSKIMVKSPSDMTPIIQQNHPGHVVNQACQTQLTESGTKLKTPNESPSHQPLDRKKSGGALIVHTLKSPITKRAPTAPVAFSGWLYKQGSDGLKVWRKRWFVLSEYCLFYYKGPEEEKVLGSILLPSYRVAACLPEDKVYRKYAFKCEHQNMRTYWLAAESAETMGQWVRALTAATMMQASSASSDQTSQPSVSSLNQSGENSDSGIHTYQSQQSKISVPASSIGPVTPASDAGLINGPQPLYANAPPKPRRATDGGYSSPSPENSIERYEVSYNEQQRLQVDAGHRHHADAKSPMAHYTEPVYDTRSHGRQSAKTPEQQVAMRMRQMRLENNTSPSVLRAQAKSPFPTEQQQQYLQEMQQLQQQQQQLQQQQQQTYQVGRENIIRAPQRFDDYPKDVYTPQDERELYVQRLAQRQYQLANQQAIAERRTPDTYGRSKSGQRHLGGDYEDIYNLAQQQQQQLQMQQQYDNSGYRRPMSPPGYTNSKHIPNMPSRYTPNHLESQPQQQQPPPQSVPMRIRNVQSVPRPHSADFLEYEAKHGESARIQPEPQRAPRPKSSLDINRTPDSFYYSEASYAEKMRQSALYLQKTSSVASKDSSKEDYPSPHANTVPRDGDYAREKHELSGDLAASVPRVHKSHSKNSISSQHEQFLRSASARLPRKDQEEVGARDGERKREESMKRLLEWKQRMLQSPLTRKGGAPLTSTPSGVKSPNLQKMIVSQGIQRSRSETNANAGYTSYSSDDEDGPQFSPAGRSSSTCPRPNTSSIVTQKQVPSSPSNEPMNTSTSSKNLSTSLLDQDTYVPVYAHKSVAKHIFTEQNLECVSECIVDGNLSPSEQCPPGKLMPSISHHHQPQTLNNVVVQKVSEATRKSDDSAYEKVEVKSTLDFDGIIDLTADDSVIDLTQDDPSNTSDIHLEESYIEEEDINDDEDEDDDKTFEYTDDDLDEALNAEDLPDDGHGTPTNNNTANTSIDEQMFSMVEDDFPEGHYMPMMPKKSILSLSESNIFMSTRPQLNDTHEESPYVEMTQSIGKLSDDGRHSTYEPVCVMNAHISHKRTESEPVYMELSQLQRALPERNKVETIIKSGHSTIRKSTLKKSADVKRKAKKSNDLMKRSNLPDILRPSQGTILSSDSSDADDESSKDFNPNEMRSRSRFSLSDTFRPASYYLGASTPLTECADSSDSEIVSPPPIPSSPPPLEELNTEELFSSENYDTIKRKEKQILNLSYDQIPKMGSNSSLSKSDNHRTSRLSLPDQLLKLKARKHAESDAEISYLGKYSGPTPSGSNFSFNTDNSSNTSSDYDLYNKVKLHSPSFGTPVGGGAIKLRSISNSCSESDSVELRQRHSDSDLERQMKRRPLSEDSFSEIESLGEKFEENVSNDNLDLYLNNLQNSDMNLYQNTERSWISAETKITDIPFIKPPEVFRSENDNENYYGNIQFVNDREENNKCNKSVGDKGLLHKYAMPAPPPPLPAPPPIYVNSETPSPPPPPIPPPPTTAALLMRTDGDYFENKRDVKVMQTATESGCLSTSTLSPLREQNLSLHDAQCKTEDLKTAMNMELANSVTLSSVDMDQQSFCTAFNLSHPSPAHSRGNSNLSDQSAPYYYSDLASRNSSNQDISNISPTAANTLQKLNNQRDISLKRTGIFHINNPINRHSFYNNTDQSAEHLQLDGRSLSTEELLTEAKEKNKLIDAKNLSGYTIEKNISREMCAGGYAGNKLYGRHIADNRVKEIDDSSSGGSSSNRKQNSETLNKSSNLSGGVPLNSSNAVMMMMTETNATTVANASDSAAGDIPWEEDSIWRESLRRVSHRHARSLDDLDRISGGGNAVACNNGSGIVPPIPSSSAAMRTRAADIQAGTLKRLQSQPKVIKITRDVTYVNEAITPTKRIVVGSPAKGGGAGHRNESTTKKYVAQPPSASNTVAATATTGNNDNDNDVYVQLAVNNDTTDDGNGYDNTSDVYETLRDDGNNAAGSGNRNVYHKSMEIDREKIRQWDSMSSGLMKSVDAAGTHASASLGVASCVGDSTRVVGSGHGAKVNPSASKMGNKFGGRDATTVHGGTFIGGGDGGT